MGPSLEDNNGCLTLFEQIIELICDVLHGQFVLSALLAEYRRSGVEFRESPKASEDLTF